MMQLRFLATADNWVKGLCLDHTASVKILGLKLVSKHHEVAHFVEIVTRDADSNKARSWLRASTSVLSTELSDLSKNHIMGVVVARDCSVCNSLIDGGSPSFISSATTEENCSVGWKVFLNGDSVPMLLNKLAKVGVPYRLVEISPISTDIHLTARQLMVTRFAMEMGLYDYPRRITQDELATRLGIKPSTLSEILRRAEKRILGQFLREGLPVGR